MLHNRRFADFDDDDECSCLAASPWTDGLPITSAKRIYHLSFIVAGVMKAYKPMLPCLENEAA